MHATVCGGGVGPSKAECICKENSSETPAFPTRNSAGTAPTMHCAREAPDPATRGTACREDRNRLQGRIKAELVAGPKGRRRGNTTWTATAAATRPDPCRCAMGRHEQALLSTTCSGERGPSSRPRLDSACCFSDRLPIRAKAWISRCIVR